MKGFLFLLLVTGICAQQSHYADFLWGSIPGPQQQPCRDFAKAVCTNKTSMSSALKELFKYQVNQAFKDFKPDAVTQELYEAAKDYEEENCQVDISIPPNSTLYGSFVASGMTDISVKIHSDTKIIEVRLNNKSEVDFLRVYNVTNFDIVYEKDVIAYLDSEKASKSSFAKKIRTLGTESDDSTNDFSV
uniref:Peptidase_M13 domain-containing protein n=1 Tax=Steinernema glaseri TaxID=37863 RepID=A0A1I8ACF2_9BILA